MCEKCHRPAKLSAEALELREEGLWSDKTSYPLVLGGTPG
jgi:hypothetical protein